MRPQKICVVLLCTLYFGVNCQFIQKVTNEGKILGKTFFTEGKNKKCYAFQGIPYAEPPKRFELPIKKAPWKGTINCTYDKSECVQGTDPITGSEDCLTLSVYTPNLIGKAPVLLWIHGGGFIYGNASYSRNCPDYFLDQDLVVVLIQYRLGVFGFLSTGDLTCPGNLGLKDQVLAIDWTRRNIHHFGGDANKITLGGDSAGAASVSYHLLSPKTKGTFKAAILNSGNAECLWSLNRNAVRIAFKIGERFGVTVQNSKLLISSFKKANYIKLQNESMIVSTQINLENFLIGTQFGVVEEVAHADAFYTGKADELFFTGNFYKVPILAGLTSNELGIGPIMTEALYTLIGTNLALRPSNLAPASLTTNEAARSFAALLIRLKYFGFAPMVPQTMAATRLATVGQFVNPVDRFIKNVAKYVKQTYYYMFSYRGVLGEIPVRLSSGVLHTEDLGYLWRRFVPNVPVEDKVIRTRMVTMWSNFCKFGEPIPQPTVELQNVKWLPASSSNPPFLLNISSTMGKINNPYQEDITFFENIIYGIFGQGHYNTY